MYKHEFIFAPGRWVGGGKITFSTSPEVIRFYTSWAIEHKNQLIYSVQRVEMHPLEAVINNNFIIYDIEPERFKIDLESELIHGSSGKGIIDAQTIAWEFHGHENEEGIEGFEVYELQENGDYMFHAEYSSMEQFRTIVDGRIWKKAT